MSWTVETTTEPVAKKKYRCDSFRLIAREGLSPENWDAADYPYIKKAMDEEGCILPGTKYLKTRGLFDGVWQTFRARIDCNIICRKYGLYDDY